MEPCCDESNIVVRMVWDYKVPCYGCLPVARH